MNRENIIRMAREAGWDLSATAIYPPLEHFARLVEKHLIESGYRKCVGGQSIKKYCCMVEEAVQEEREACARVCEVDVGMLGKGEAGEFWTYMCAKAIRARGEV